MRLLHRLFIAATLAAAGLANAQYDLSIQFSGYQYRAYGLTSIGAAGELLYDRTGGRLNTIDLLDARWESMAIEDTFWRPEGNGWMQRADAGRNYDDSAKYASIFDVQYLNPYGASYSVPFGSYKGSQIVGLYAGKRALQKSDIERPDGMPTGKWKEKVPGDLIETSMRVANVGRTIGWRFEPGGMLQAELFVLDTSKTPLPAPQDDRVNIRCVVTQRFTYVGPAGVFTFIHDGIERPRAFFVNNRGINEQPNPVCLAAIPDGVNVTSYPTRYRSTIGGLTLDVGNPARPVITAPNGTKEVMGTGAESAGPPQPTQFEFIFNPPAASGPARSLRILGSTYTAKIVDANDNVTRFRSSANETSVEDSAGRVTRYLRDADGDIAEIVKPGPLDRQSLRWVLKWTTFTWNAADALADITCPRVFESEERVPCNYPITYKTLAELVIPDGRKYTFDYRLPDGRPGWGALTGVTTPDGAAERFRYGDGGTFSHQLPLFDREDMYPEGSGRLAGRRVTMQTVLPSGAGGPAYDQTITHETEVTPTRGAPCRFIEWIRTSRSEQSGTTGKRATRNGVCGTGLPFDAVTAAAQGRTIIEETLDADGNVIAATYFGNPGRLPFEDTSRAGELFLDFELVSTRDRIGSDVSYPIFVVADPRPTRVIRVRDGLASVESYEYDRSAIPAANGKTRTFGNITVKKLLDADGNALLETQTDFLQDPNYEARNLVRLPSRVRVLGASPAGFRLLASTGIEYDESARVASGSERLDPEFAARERGNATSATRFPVAATDDQPENDLPPSIGTTTRYFDNGAVQEIGAPGGRITTTAQADFRACSASRPIRETVTLSPDPGTGRHRHVTRTDCFTGLVLSSIDPNGHRSCNQFDALGRLVETAVPGDQLSTLASGVRDPECVPTGQAVLGSGGRGPTTWTDYRELGRIGTAVGGSDATHQHTITWTKNGTATGRYVKKFVDGLGRAVQACEQVDPTTNANNVEVCSFKRFDDSGNTDIEYLPFYLAAARTQVSLPPDRLQYTRTELDALGRPTRIELVDSGVRASTLRYGSDGRVAIVESVNPNGHRAVSRTNLLGQRLESARESALCENNSCATTTTYDALGRIWRMRGATNVDGTGGHEASFVYDGFGRRKEANDPSLKRRTFRYDDAGNMTETRDAKGQTISYVYDRLNRVTTKTLGDPSGRDRAAERVVTYSYDTAPNAKGRLVALRNGLVETGFGYDALGRVIADSFTAEGSTLRQRFVYGYAKRAAQGSEPGDRLLAETRSDGEIVRYGYDADGRASTIDAQPPGGVLQPVISRIRRNVHGDITEVAFGNGIVSRHTYDENRSWRPAGTQVFAGRAALLDLGFRWDDNGNVIEVNNRSQGKAYASWRYQYDSLDQLTSATTFDPVRIIGGNRGGRPFHPAWTLEFGYTGTGNLETKSVLRPAASSFTIDKVRQRYGENGASPFAVTASGNDTFRYDPIGNLEATSSGVRLEWNVENMPVATYRGARLTTEKWFLGEALWKRVESDPATDRITTTLYPSASVQVENGRFRHRYGAFAERDPRDARLRFFHRDQVGSTALVTDDAGQVVYDAVYQPYGEDLHVASRYDPLEKFAGREREKASGFYDFGARLYLPQTGRWASADSVDAGALPDRLNRYHYASNNPSSRFDPDGHQDQEAVVRISTVCVGRRGWCNYDNDVWAPVGGTLAGSVPPAVPRFFVRRNPSAVNFFGLSNGARTVWLSTIEIYGSEINPLVHATKPVTILSGTHGNRDGSLARHRAFYWEDVDAHGAKSNVKIMDVWDDLPKAKAVITNAPGEVICAYCNGNVNKFAGEALAEVPPTRGSAFTKFATGVRVAGTGLAVIGVAGATVEGYKQEGVKGAVKSGGAAAADATFCGYFPTLCAVFGMTTLQWKMLNHGGSMRPEDNSM